jgi:hypothetical protein
LIFREIDDFKKNILNINFYFLRFIDKNNLNSGYMIDLKFTLCCFIIEEICHFLIIIIESFLKKSFLNWKEGGVILKSWLKLIKIKRIYLRYFVFWILRLKGFLNCYPLFSEFIY